MTRIVSSVPGRIRLRDQALRRPATLERLRVALAVIDGVLSAEGNAVAGSIVLRYDVAQAARPAIAAQVEAAAEAALAVSHRPQPRRTHSPRRRVNRYAKYGMLGSLATSLAFAAAGRKRWHAASGGLFLVCLAMHLTMNRRDLLR